MKDRLDFCKMVQQLDEKPEDEEALRKEINKKVLIILKNPVKHCKQTMEEFRLCLNSISDKRNT